MRRVTRSFIFAVALLVGLGVLLAATSAERASAVGPRPAAKPSHGVTFLGVQIAQTSEGVVVSKVVEGGPADAAGVKRGDLILSFNGQNIRKISALRLHLRRLSPGDEVPVVVERDGDGLVTLSVVLGELPKAKKHRPQGAGRPFLRGHPSIVQGSFTVLGKDGQPVALQITSGRLAAVDVSAGDVTITRPDGESATFQVPTGSHIATPGHRGATLEGLKERLDALKEGESISVLVVQKDGEVKNVVLMPSKPLGRKDQYRRGHGRHGLVRALSGKAHHRPSPHVAGHHSDHNGPSPHVGGPHSDHKWNERWQRSQKKSQ